LRNLHWWFFMLTVLICIPMNRVQGFPFIYILSSTLNLDNSHYHLSEDISLCFDLHFPDDEGCWTFSHVPVVHLYVCLLVHVCLGLSSIF
jgi:hypothetical protein